MKKNTIDQNVTMTVKSLSIVVAALGLSLGTTIESVHAADASNIPDKTEVYRQDVVKPQTTIRTTDAAYIKFDKRIEAESEGEPIETIQSTVNDSEKLEVTK